MKFDGVRGIKRVTFECNFCGRFTTEKMKIDEHLKSQTCCDCRRVINFAEYVAHMDDDQLDYSEDRYER